MSLPSHSLILSLSFPLSFCGHIFLFFSFYKESIERKHKLQVYFSLCISIFPLIVSVFLSSCLFLSLCLSVSLPVFLYPCVCL